MKPNESVSLGYSQNWEEHLEENDTEQYDENVDSKKPGRTAKKVKTS